MSDGKKTCLGFAFLITALVLGGLILFAGGLGSIFEFLGIDFFGLDLKSGAIISLIVFTVFSILAGVSFFTIKNWSWMPAILGGVYAVMPDLIAGPADDAVAVLLGVIVSSYLAWRSESKKPPSDIIDIEETESIK